MFQAKRLQISATTSVRNVALGFLLSIMHASVQNARCRVAVKAWWPQLNPRILFAIAAFFLLHRDAVQIYELVVTFYCLDEHTMLAITMHAEHWSISSHCKVRAFKARSPFSSMTIPDFCKLVAIVLPLQTQPKPTHFLRSQLHLLASTCQPGLLA